MHYYEVYVAESSYQKREPLTYSSNDVLPPGQVVTVPYGKKTVSGFVVRAVPQPQFKTKQVLAIIERATLPPQLIDLHKWMLAYYPSGSGALTQIFAPSGLKSASEPSSKKIKTKTLPLLTQQQLKALEAFEKSDHNSFLLHGETGSGKTRIYIELAKKTIEKGLSVIILTPEISLVPQLHETFSEVFSHKVTTIHSGLTKAKRNKNWLFAAQSSEPVVVIGTRSATFSPLEKVGLIVVDEMHEPAYKQESGPRYNALRAAAKLASLHKAKLIYGSATPAVVEYYMAVRTDSPIIRLTETARAPKKVKKQIIDLKDPSLFSRHRYLSDNIVKSIGNRLANGEQSMIFLNRRGTARQIICQDCGWQALCPRCDLPLTFHSDSHILRCHTCGFTSKPPYSCPECGSDDISYRSLGTKALVEDLHRLFPEANIRRFDTDNLAADKLSQHFDAVHAGEIDILVGTQMLGKGLDLPKLSLVGIVNADTSLHMPDFSSAERSYQLMHQAIGRVGRGHRDGEVIVQSFRPEDPLLVAALSQNWQALYEHELAERQKYRFPPFCFLLKLTVSRSSSQAAEKYIGKLRSVVLSSGLKLDIQEPTPSFYERSHGKYNWQLVIKSKDRGQLTKLIDLLPAGDYIYDIDPLNLL